jgi:oxalate decarboxylase
VSDISRRRLLTAGAAIAASASAARLANAATQAPPQPQRGNEGSTILGPRNQPLEQQNPDLLTPPSSDAGDLQNLKFSFDDAHVRLATGGWTRQVTVNELPIATTLAGVDMRLKPGGIREMHWHEESEWSIMLAGNARITAMDAGGRNFIADVGKGDLWYFPAGIPHSIQALKDGCEFLLVFDSGDFSEFNTFMLTDWFAHTPADVLAKNFGVPKKAFAGIPPDIESQRYMFPGKVPPPLALDTVGDPAGTVPQSFAYKLSAQKPIACPGGRVRVVDSTNFHASTTIAAVLVEVDPGGMREMHWHPNADEWQYYLGGTGRMTVFAAEGTANTFDFQAGDVGYIPFPMGHYVENTGNDTLTFLEMFRTDRYADISLDQWLALTPPELVREHLPISQQTVGAFSKTQRIVVK